jgi:hypothetical protein
MVSFGLRTVAAEHGKWTSVRYIGVRAHRTADKLNVEIEGEETK